MRFPDKHRLLTSCLPGFRIDRIPVVPEAAEGLKRVARDRLAWLDGLMQGRDFLCGARFTLGDMMLCAFLDFGAGVGQPLDPERVRVRVRVRKKIDRLGSTGSRRGMDTESPPAYLKVEEAT